ncbi:MAG: TAXI family TRAP transporter solute-binding subunit [Desulfosarcina sp.]|nr:TAXI family TRAP transporter solute-binding subunit [Desulfobacterales bacterium]
MKIASMTTILMTLLWLISPLPANAISTAANMPAATIGAGAVTGVYFNTGQAIKKTLKRNAGELDIKIVVKATQGSVETLEAVESGRFYFGFVQSDLQYKAWHGVTGTPWAGRPQKHLRAVFGLYTEAINLVVQNNQKIASLQDLVSKRVNLGQPGSGQYINAKELLEAFGIHPRNSLSVVTASPVDTLRLFERNEIDAFFFTAGHPAGQFYEVAAGKRKGRFVALTDLEDLLQKYPYYSRTSIPIHYYPGIGNDQDVATIGVKATLIASDGAPDRMVYEITKAVFENLDYFKTQLLVFRSMNREEMLEHLSAPIHPGALKYYREVGLDRP